MEEVTDEPLYRDRVCGIDIGKAGMAATIRVPSDKDPARRASETRTFGTTKREVLALADWMRSWQVPAVVMEAPDYWKGPFYRLEAEGFDCVLAGAKQVKHLPGRPKRDPADSRWLAACFERGAVTSCFVATPEFRVIRLHTRYRRDLTDERTREKQRAEKLLESAAVKLSSVVTDLHGVTGRDIMDHLIAGERNPKVLAQLARARARRKISELEEALEGAEFFTPAHAALLAAMLARIDRVNQQIGRLTGVIEQLLAPYEEQLQQAESQPGWGRRAAQDSVAETGIDMTRFATGGHLASWAGRTPLDNQSGTRNGRSKSKKGNRYLGGLEHPGFHAHLVLCDAASPGGSAVMRLPGAWSPAWICVIFLFFCLSNASSLCSPASGYRSRPPRRGPRAARGGGQALACPLFLTPGAAEVSGVQGSPQGCRAPARCAAPWRPEERPRSMAWRAPEMSGGEAASFLVLTRPAQRARRGHAASLACW